MAKHYKKGNTTIVWDHSKCIHSAKCVAAAPAVFKPKERPWIQPENASEENIIKTVSNCPSGALSLLEEDFSPSLENDSSAQISFMKNGPAIVEGPFTVELPDGTSIKDRKRVALCRCGFSNKKPLCDGSHDESGWVE